jgi:NAD(P)-dependent dehydrogenase (short-subunit alcohol dehydrogenase family)
MAVSPVEVLLLLSGTLIILRFVNIRSWGKCTSKQSLTGKTFIVTGGNSGIGKSIVTSLAARGAQVIVACRNVAQAKLEFDQHPNASLILVMHLDLQSFTSVLSFAEEVNRTMDRVNCLISNAGLFGTPFTVTEDGFELQHQVNHLSHALLQMLLLPKLEASGDTIDPARIVSVTSTRALKASIKWNEMTRDAAKQETYDRKQSYDSSKLAAALFNFELAERLKLRQAPVSVMIASPGLVWTNLFRHEKRSFLSILLFAPIAFAFMRSADQGSQTVLQV